MPDPVREAKLRRDDRSTPEAVPAPEPLPASVFDAHAHLDAMAQRAGLEPTHEFVADVMARAREVGVVRVITVGDTVESSRWCVDAAAHHPDVFAAVAVHPTEVEGMTDADYAQLEQLAGHPKVVAIGETGLDYYWDGVAAKTQQEHFRRHIYLAKRTGKTLMIHDRDAHQDVLRILAEERPPERVVFHAFSGDADMARTCVAAGFVLSIPGVISFTNAPGLRAAVAAAPPSSLLVETDAPFLTPHPFRGRPNAPYLLPHTVLALARAIEIDPAQLCDAVRVTGARVFDPVFAEV
jgi:TatD DNase family protein